MHVQWYERERDCGRLCDHWDLLGQQTLTKPYFSSTGWFPIGQPAAAGLLGHDTHRDRRYPQRLCLQTPVQKPCLLLPRREWIHIREVSLVPVSTNEVHWTLYGDDDASMLYDVMLVWCTSRCIHARSKKGALKAASHQIDTSWKSDWVQSMTGMKGNGLSRADVHRLILYYFYSKLAVIGCTQS